MKDNENYDGFDGNRLRHNEMFALLQQQYEERMWAQWKRQHPDGVPWNKVANTDGIVGKAIFTSTVDSPDSEQEFIELWNDSSSEKESGLYSIFRPSFEANSDEFGFKKDEDEK